MAAVTLASTSPAPKPHSKARNRDRAAARAAERQLLLRYHRWGDLAAREELVERFLPLARDLALRYTYTEETFDDLFQVASLGLIKAIDRFDADRGAKFPSYAAPTILGELKRHFRDKGWALHVPRDLQERTLAVSRETEALSKRLARSPKRARSRRRSDALSKRCSRRRRSRPATRRPRWTPRARDDDDAVSLLDLMGNDDSAYSLSRAGTRSRAPGRRCRKWSARCSSCAHVRPHPARDRRTDRLLADARLAPPTARSQSP